VALDVTSKRVARSLRDAVREYARSRSWPSGTFRIFLRHRNGHWHVLLVSRQLRGTTGYKEWLDVQEFLESTFPHDPELLSRLNLGVRSEEQTAEGGLYAIPSDYRDVT
jgi:hypothetical protein